MSDNYKMEETDESLEQARGNKGGRGWAIAGIVCGVLALVLVPVIFGPAGIILGIVGRVRGAGTLSIVAIIVSVVGLIAGLALGAFMTSLAAGVEG